MEYLDFFKELLIENKSNINTVYHGTTKTNAENIIKHKYDINKSGLKSGYGLRGVSTTISYDIALEHAEWAANKFKDEQCVIMTYVSSLNLMSGKEFAFKFKVEDVLKILKNAKNKYDGVIMFDYESEIGLEELEVLIFNVDKLSWVFV